MHTNRSARRASRTAMLLCGAAAIGLIATAANAQAPKAAAGGAATDEGTTVEAVVVTGTSIRGAPPVGAAVEVVGQVDIQKTGAQTIQQVLRSVPSVVGLGAVGQGSFGSADGAGTNAPTIHGLGASASNSTLILIDGHRIPLSGINHALADPNILAPLSLERVEVLAEGASSVYGSDAVAGVINFITRRRFDGLEARVQKSWANGYDGWSANVVAGKTWDGGSVLAAYGHSDRSALSNSDRSFTALDKRALGGSNLGSFFCAPATIQVGSSGNIFTSPYSGAGVANAAVNAPCDYTGLADLIPSEKRDSVMVKVTQNVSDKLTLSGDVIYSDRNNSQRNTRGTIQATIFGPGATQATQINPFWVGLPGNAATSESVRFDANELLGPGAHTDSGEEAGYASGNAIYQLTDNWRITAGGVVGGSNSRSLALGALCSSCALLALNGTTNGGGSLTAASIPGTNIVVTQTPLTAANALDVFHTGSANLASAAVRAKLTDSQQLQTARQTLKDATVKLDGELFKLPGGTVKSAFGAEVIYYTMTENVTRPNNTGPATTGSTFTHLDFDRNVRSVFAEFLIPVIGPDMMVPGVRSLDVNLSGRYDDYNDFGTTKNPKAGVNWEVFDGFKLRANYARSFVAPALTSRGDINGTTAETSVSGGPTVNVPTAAYPGLIGGVPGCAVGAVTCTLGGGVAGLQINGGNAALKPQTGISWSYGLDWTPSFVPGLKLSVTYWSDQLKGAITAPSATLAVNATGLNSLLKIFPGGVTATDPALLALLGNRPLTTSIPATVYYVYNFQQRNALSLDVEGIDVSVHYGLDTSIGRIGFDVAGSYKTKFDQQVGVGSAWFSVLGSTGFNTTFPSIKLETRSGVSWDSKFGLSADVFWNHTDAHHNWSNTTVTPITKTAAGAPTGGGDKVKAGDTIDLHVAYDFKSDGYAKDLQVFADVNNLFDKTPSFYNANAGYDPATGNPIGRLITVGAKKKF